MLTSFVAGARYPVRGLGWLTKPGLRRYVALPLAINTLLFGGLIYWGMGTFDGLATDMSSYLANWLPDWLDWLATTLYWLLWPLFAVTVLVLVFYTFTLVANLIGGPFNGMLAEQVENLVNPQHNRPPARPLWQEIAITPVVELKKIAYFLLWALPLLVLFFIPLVNLAAPLIWMAFSAWMLALQYAEYPMANHRIAFKDQRQLLAKKRGLVLGFGAMVLLLTLIPVLNFVSMPAAVIGATLLWVERFAERQIQQSN